VKDDSISFTSRRNGNFCEQNVKVPSLWSATIKTKYGLQVKVILLRRGRRFYLEQYEVLIAASHATFIVEHFRASVVHFN